MRTIIATILMVSTINLFADNRFDGNKAVVKAEFIYNAEDVPFPSCHASTIDETEDGLVAAWFGGSHEKNPDVGIWFSKFKNGKWTVPVEVANGVQHAGLRYPTWNPVLFDYGDELFLFYKDGPTPSTWWGQLIISGDNGETWSRRMRLPEEIYGPIKNKPELLEDRTLICPTSTEHDGWQVHMEFTSDRGITWERTDPVNDGDEIAAIQPSILKHADGRLQILCRSKNKKILSAFSSDKGKAWSKLEPIDLPNPNSGTDAVTLNDGRHLLVYNHINPDEVWGNRNILNVAVSNDGINWEAAVLLENDKDPDGEYSYPAVTQGDDGLVHITYTWNRKLIKHVVLDPSKLKTKPIKNGKWPKF